MNKVVRLTDDELERRIRGEPVSTDNQHSGSAAGQGSRSDASAWPTMDEAAYQGLAREVVEAIKPHSEADPVAILIQFLALAGNAMGRTAYYLVEDDRHHTNLFAVLVGESSKARKGTSLGRVRAIMKVADQGWSDDRLKGGLSSRGAHQCGPRRAARVEQERGPRGNHRSRHR